MRIKSSLLTLFFIGISLAATAQRHDNKFGIKGGLNMTFFSVDQQELGSFETSETSFYGGVFLAFPMANSLTLQPELLYICLGDFNFLNVPLYAKYEVANNLHFMAGPSINYFFDFFSNKLKIGADIGSSYNITQALDVHVKFALGIDALAPNGLFFGLGLKI